MKKLFKLVALMLSLLLVFGAVACFGGGNPDSGNGGNTGGGNTGGGGTGGGSGSGSEASYTVDIASLKADPSAVTGTLTIGMPGKTNEIRHYNALKNGFNLVYPNVTVRRASINLDNYTQTITMGFSGDEIGDVFFVDSDKYHFLIDGDIALNLDTMMTAIGAAEADNAESNMVTEFQNMGKYNGSRYAVPRTIDSILTFYNKTLMSAAGVDMTQYNDGWTWEQFLAVCEQVRTYLDGAGMESYYPLQPNFNWSSMANSIIESLGGTIIGANGKYALTDEIAGQAYDLINNLLDNMYCRELSAADLGNFEAGTSPMLFQSTSIGNFMEKQALVEKGFDVVPFPKINGEDAKIGTGFAGFSVTTKVLGNQSRINLSALFLDYLMSYDGQEALARDGKLTSPSIRKDLGDYDKTNATWYNTYSDTHNMDAYLWGSEYKTELNYANNLAIEKVPVVTSNIVAFMGDYVYNYGKAEAIQKLKDNLNLQGLI